MFDYSIFETIKVGSKKNIQAWTDYPLFEKEYGKEAPLRRITVISYDRNKYCKILYKNQLFEIKAGYIYRSPTGYLSASTYWTIFRYHVVSLKKLKSIPYLEIVD